MQTLKRKLEITAVVLFLAIHMAAPFVLGELYPFTVSPMFSDQPAEYAVYEVLDAGGKPMALEPFGLHLSYDGNPVGLGMGIKATPTLHDFGHISTLNELENHVQKRLQEMPDVAAVLVRRKHVFCQNHKLVQVINEVNVVNPLSQRRRE